MKEIGLFLVLACFWNLENYYHPSDDPQTADEDFTPAGSYHWTYSRFNKKRDDIAKTILSIRDYYGSYPALIGFAEVESRQVLRELVERTPLAALEYEVIHRDSPDRRGIDVGMLYRKADFRPLAVKSIPLKVHLQERDSILATRTILYVKGILYGKDSIHLFINHWPSKRGGGEVANRNRMIASNTLKHYVDSLLFIDKNAKILAMGDLNDGVESEAVSNIDNLINLAKSRAESAGAKGSYKYKESWELIDHLMVSPQMVAGKLKPQMRIFSGKLLVEDSIYLGMKPLRTYSGPRYLGGVSDHLPLLLVYPQGQ